MIEPKKKRAKLLSLADFQCKHIRFGLVLSIILFGYEIGCSPPIEGTNEGSNQSDNTDESSNGSEDSTTTTPEADDGEDPSEESEGTGTNMDDLKGPCPIDKRVSNFRVQVDPKAPSVSGRISDGVVPQSVLQPISGDPIKGCSLYSQPNPHCDPICGPSEFCDFSETCVPYPRQHSAGTIEVLGLVEPVSMIPIGEEGSQQYFFTELPPMIVDVDAKLRLVAHGDENDVTAFELHGYGVGPLPDDPSLLTLRKSRDLELTWEVVGKKASIRIRIFVDQHGASPLHLICDVPDSGTFSVPKELIKQLIESGVTGFPSLAMTRQVMNHTFLPGLGPGCVQFEVSSTNTQGLKVDGHAPCKTDADCPEGLICDTTIETCVEEAAKF